ncbi:hypothetical protein LguiB_027254 [Lonicera macranthoides]
MEESHSFATRIGEKMLDGLTKSQSLVIAVTRELTRQVYRRTNIHLAWIEYIRSSHHMDKGFGPFGIRCSGPRLPQGETEALCKRYDTNRCDVM